MIQEMRMKRRLSNRILALCLSASMVLPTSGQTIVAAETFDDTKQQLTITQLEMNEAGIEEARNSEDAVLLEIYNRVKSQAPVLSEDGTKIILPETGNGKYEISLYGSSNKAVIAMDGTVTQPLEDMDVYLYYQVTNVENQDSLHMDDPILVKVNGMYDDTQKGIKRPEIMPSIREWKANDGEFAFDGTIVIADESVRDAAEIVETYIEGMTAIDVTITTGDAQAGNIWMAYDESLSVGKEGYTLTIDDVLEVRAPEYVGLVYAGATITQMLTTSTDYKLSKGLMRDYPQYEVRSTMLDLARFYMPLDYLQEVTTYAAFFKLNEFHAHINDNGGEQNQAFRIESKKYPAANSGIPANEVYSQEDYKAYQKYVKKFGIDVVTEIDTPAHAGFIYQIDSSLMYDGFHINIRSEEAMKFIESLYDEFLDGDDPVFQSSKFNIGVDEYEYTYAEDVRAYMDRMSKYVAAKGIEPRLWCSLNDTKPTGNYQGYGGNTPVTNLGVQHFYNDSTADLHVLLDGEYRIINNMYQNLYIVPTLINGCNDYMNFEKCYNDWEVGRVSYGENEIQPGHPLLLGAETTIWYDGKVGCSQFDIFDRCKDQIMIMSEKNWYGKNTEGKTLENFLERVETFSGKTPIANPARNIDSVSDVVAAYNFAKLEGTTVLDISGNGYDATVTGLTVNSEKNALELDGEGYIALPFDSVGFPYSVDFSLSVSADTPKNAVFFNGKDGTLYFNYDGTGKIGFERKGYKFIFDYEIPTDIMLNYTIQCKDEKTYLYVENALIGEAELYNTYVYREDHSTFVLPVEEIGKGVKGYLQSLKISTKDEGYDIGSVEDIARNKKVTVSGLEGGYNDNGTPVYPQFDPQHVVDRNNSTRTSLDYIDNAWLQIDLESVYWIERIETVTTSTPDGFDIMVSEDGVSWTTISSRKSLANGDAGINSAIADTYVDTAETLVKARYVKYQQTKMWHHADQDWDYSAGISEIYVYGVQMEAIDKLIQRAETVLKETEVTDDNRAFIAYIRTMTDALKAACEKNELEEVQNIAVQLDQLVSDLEIGNTTIVDADKEELKQLLDEQLDLSAFKDDLVNIYKNAIKIGKSIYNDVHATQEKVDFAVREIKEAKENFVEKDPEQINLALNKTVTVSGLEVQDGRFTGEMAVDGDANTRVSLHYDDNAWLKVDLGKVYTVDCIEIDWNQRPNKYQICISADGEKWKTVYEDLECNPMSSGTEKIQLDAGTKVRYIKYQQLEMFFVSGMPEGVQAYYSGNFWEIRAIGYDVCTEELEALVSEIEQMDLNGYTDDSVSALNDALNHARTELGKEKRRQQDIDNALENLQNAKNNLLEKEEPDNLVNLALNKPVAVSGLEVQDGRFTGEMAVDGNSSTRVSFHYDNNAWLKVNLEKVYIVDRIEIDWNERPNKYQVCISVDGENWDTVFEDLACEPKSSGTEVINLDAETKVRYVKYQQLEMFYLPNMPEGQQHYSGNFWELRVLGVDEPIEITDKTLLNQTIEEADALVDAGTLSGIDTAVAESFNLALTHAKEAKADEDIKQDAVDQLVKELKEAIDLVKYTVEKKELTALIAECDAIDLRAYKEDGKAEYQAALAAAKELAEKDEVVADGSIKAAADRLAAAKDALVEKEPIENPFEDVKEGSYYYDAVLWAVENKITSGTTETTFSPKEDCTRAQVVMFLWRAAGSPDSTIEENPFSDVSESSRFYPAILWAYENEITKGYSNGTFRPDDTVRRGEYVTMQYRAAGEPELTTSENPFVDVTEEQYPHYVNAILWAYENGITEGKDATHFLPNDNCSRANVVTFLYRATEK